MRVQRGGTAIGIVLVLFVGWVATGFVGARAGDKSAAGGEFDGKYLMVYFNDGTLSSAFLEKVQVKKLGDKLFLVGTGVDSEEKDEWQKGRPVWVALERVTQIIVFPSRLELVKALKTSPKAAEKK